AVTFEVLTPPAHGTLSGTAPNLIYTPDYGYEGDDNLIYRANTEQNLAASARIAFRNVSTQRSVTSAAAIGPRSLAEILSHAPNLHCVTWNLSCDPSLENATIELPSIAVETAVGPSAFVIGGSVAIDGSAAPGLTIKRADAGADMRLFYVPPYGN